MGVEPNSLVSREIRFAVTTYCDNEQDKTADTASQMGWNTDTACTGIRHFPMLSHNVEQNGGELCSSIRMALVNAQLIRQHC